MRPRSSEPEGRRWSARVRLRSADDLGQCVRLLEAVHETDGYPTYWPDDPARWLSPSSMLGAWVAEDAERVVGHVALGPGAAEADATIWAEATGRPSEEFAAISRLFVAPDSRGAGVASALLAAACAEAAARRLHPALDVVENCQDAIRLYERWGWQRVGSEPWTAARDGKTLLLYYVAPAST